MNGAELMVATAVDAGIDTVFANPGTTEMQLVAALDTVDGVRAVLGLFEGVVTGAADGYGRMAGRPALTVLHLGPGFANGIANLHNARRARSPIVNLVGDHATWHRDADAPLTSDITSLAAPVGWVRTCTTAEGLGDDVLAARDGALAAPGGPATLVVPQDLTWTSVSSPVPSAPPPPAPGVDPGAVEAAARALRDGTPTVMLLGGDALTAGCVEAAHAVASATGCTLLAETFAARTERGGGLPEVAALPYFPEQAIDALAGFDRAVLAGAVDPVAFFGYPDQPSRLLPDACERIVLAAPGRGAGAAVEDLADALGAGRAAAREPSTAPPERATGPLTTAALGSTVAACQPDGAIVVNEAATSGQPWVRASAGSPRHDVLALTGGAIGQGMPCAVGAAVAAPDRPVVAFQADGSGVYTNQALWTMAREALDVTVVVCANRAYKILQYELYRAGVAEPGPAAAALMDLRRPTIGWADIASGFGVPAWTVESADDLARRLDEAFASPGPHLIEAVLA